MSLIKEAYQLARENGKMFVTGIAISGKSTRVSYLDGDEERVLLAFSPGVLLSSSRVVALTGFGKDKVLRVLKGLVTKGLASVQGSGRGTRYVMS